MVLQMQHGKNSAETFLDGRERNQFSEEHNQNPGSNFRLVTNTRLKGEDIAQGPGSNPWAGSSSRSTPPTERFDLTQWPSARQEHH